MQSLLRPGAYAHPADDVQLIQTHISWLLLAGDYVYKIKKAVRFGFLDYGTLSRREEMCAEEVRLNRRTCADAYLGVTRVVERDGLAFLFGPGRTVDYTVKMRRLSEEGWLSSRIDRTAAPAELLRRIADSLRAFHAAAAHDEKIARYGSAREVSAIWRENLEEVEPYAGDTLAAGARGEIAAFGERFLATQGALIDERAASGRARDCHGDLRSDSIHIGADEQICITDCIEFSERLRWGDVAGDVGFLGMDLDFRGRADLSDEFSGRYVAASPDDETLAFMLPFYRCYRAVVRAKVESITSREPEVGQEQAAAARERAREYFALARRYASAARPYALIVVGGLSGTGKSHFAAALAARIGAVLVRTDAIRREGGAGSGAAATYSADARRRVYEAARERARGHLEAKRAVVLDATHLGRAEREAARQLAARCGAPAVLAWVEAPEDIVRTRLAARDADLSDARWETYVAQRGGMDQLTEDEQRGCAFVDGSQPATVNIAAFRERLEAAGAEG